jgi:hypothetical protein
MVQRACIYHRLGGPFRAQHHQQVGNHGGLALIVQIEAKSSPILINNADMPGKGLEFCSLKMQSPILMIAS